ncbi:uncharacterized protein LTR77_007732 [Saxophila tyrrhenica]|uniref:Uncharacterized protein n=1 Tax=Saxophila tyrrhenica TaxID=1690608 RepID=A0AAV9P6V0_9PEZI|nr:hypothetical protein LTR77_007732 [Saxophila tyrrhenica]
MPSSQGRQTATPVIVEVRPSNVGSSNVAPATPPESPNTKKARFASTVVNGTSRPLTPTEAWSLYHFETHAQKCADCHDPARALAKGQRLCDAGHALARDVAEHVYHQSGEIYSKGEDDHKPVRVEIHPGYKHARSLLQAIDRALRSRSRKVPIVSYDRSYPVSPRRRSSPDRREERREDRREEKREDRRERERKYENDKYEKVTVEPASSVSRRKSSHKSKRYSTVVVDDDVEVTSSRQPEPKPQPKSESRKGSLYDAEIQRQKRDKGYVVEIREPSSRGREREREREERRKDERQRSGYYY